MLTVVDQYGSEYGYTREYTLENVYIDEYFIQRDIINKRQNHHYLMLAQIQLLTMREQKDIQKFFNTLLGDDKSSLIGKKVETDFDAIKKAKETIKNMNL
jgi:Mg2+/Co2+ transporter CorC